MPKLTSAQVEGLSHCLFDLYRAGLDDDRESFIGAAFDRYQTLVPHDAAAWGAGRRNPEPQKSPILHYFHLHRLSLAELLPAWQSNPAEQLRMTSYMADHSESAQVVHGGTPGLERTFQELFGRHGIRHLVGIYLFDHVAKLFNIVSLYRTRDIEFTEAERYLHELIAPHLVAVFRNHVLARISPQGRVGHGVAAAADRRGTLHHADPGFVRFLNEEWPSWHGPDLPAAIASGGPAPTLRAAYVGQRIVIHAHEAGELYHLHARYKGLIDELSVREKEAIQHFSSGLNHKEVAQILAISPATVRNHLASAYRKLGVSDKAGLAKLLAEHQRFLK